MRSFVLQKNDGFYFSSVLNKEKNNNRKRYDSYSSNIIVHSRFIEFGLLLLLCYIVILPLSLILWWLNCAVSVLRSTQNNAKRKDEITKQHHAKRRNNKNYFKIPLFLFRQAYCRYFVIFRRVYLIIYSVASL